MDRGLKVKTLKIARLPNVTQVLDIFTVRMLVFQNIISGYHIAMDFFKEMCYYRVRLPVELRGRLVK